MRYFLTERIHRYFVLHRLANGGWQLRGEMEKTSTAFTQAFAGAPCKSQFALCSKWQICMGLHDQLHLRCFEQVHILVFCAIFAPASSCCVLLMVVAVGAASFGASHGSICWSLLVKSRNSENLEWNQKNNTPNCLKGLRFGSSRLPLSAWMPRLKRRNISHAFPVARPLPWLPLLEMRCPKYEGSQGDAVMQLTPVLYGFIRLYCFWRLP